jgi:RimJ/RimL family protein N-acetyltransferase
MNATAESLREHWAESMTIHLRPTTTVDLDFVLHAEQSDDNRAFVHQWTRERHLAALSNPDVAHLIVERTADHRPVGYVILMGLQDPNQSLEFRRIVITEKRNGYGREAVRLIKKLAFEEWHAHRLWLDVKDHNLGAKRLYESEGFVAEGVLRECIKAGDKFESLVVMSMLMHEYHKI